jgi:predicted transcriptional regulator
MLGDKQSSPSLPGAAVDIESHYTVGEIAQQWNVCENTVRNIFRDEPGVLLIGRPSRLMRRGSKTKFVRRYGALRIPQSVFVRVRNRLMDKRGVASVTLPAGAAGIAVNRRDVHAS